MKPKRAHPAKAKTTRPRGFVASWHPQAKTRALLDTINAVLVEYREHLPLTIRQIFYRMVANHGYAKNEKAYDNLAELLTKARRARAIDFAHAVHVSSPSLTSACAALKSRRQSTYTTARFRWTRRGGGSPAMSQ